MKELKFKAWDKVKEEWVYSSAFPSMWRYFKELEDRGIRHFESREHIGRKDKNEVDLYEDDIVQLKYGNMKQPFKAQVKWALIGWGLLGEEGVGWFSDRYLLDDKCEIIGNMQENREIINRAED